MLINHLKWRLTSSSDLQEHLDNVLELGTGTGVVGLFLASHVGFNIDDGLKSLILTDLPCLLSLITENVHNNGLTQELNKNLIQVKPLIWGEPYFNVDYSTQSSLSSLNYPSLLLISDCVYLENCFDPLLQTMQELIGPNTLCLMSYKKRWRKEKRFFSRLFKLFNVTKVTDDPDYIEYSRNRMFIYEIKRK